MDAVSVGISVPRVPKRPPAIDAEKVAQAVLAVGFQALTFAAVARRLEVSQATLFRHVADRDELIRLGIDRAIRQWRWPGVAGPWRDVLERWALASWRVWAAHPGAVVEVGRGVVAPALLALSNELAAVLLRAEFSPSNALLAVELVFDLAADSRRSAEALDGGSGGASGPGARERIAQQWRFIETHPSGHATTEEWRRIHQAVTAATQEDPEAWFLTKLGVVVAGIEWDLAPRAAAENGTEGRTGRLSPERP